MAPHALRAQGLLIKLKAKDGGSIIAPSYSFQAPGNQGIRNAENIAIYSEKLATAVGELIDSNDFPLVLGGDCSILLGSMLALRERGRYGLFFLDGHKDLQTPETSRTGGAAGMDLALVLGHGPPLLSDLKGLGPLLSEENLVLAGYRDSYQGYLQISKALSVGLEVFRKRGFEKSTMHALKWLEEKDLDGIWLHCDVDILDSNVMPAVDSPQADGFSYEELTTVIRSALLHSHCVGMQITIFDPDLDPEGHYARELSEMLHNAFAGIS